MKHMCKYQDLPAINCESAVEVGELGITPQLQAGLIGRGSVTVTSEAHNFGKFEMLPKADPCSFTLSDTILKV